MSIMKRTLIYLHLTLLALASASSAVAADQVTPQPYPCLWRGGTQWPAFGWIFPLACFVMMVVMLLFMMRRGGMGCMWPGRSPDKTRVGDIMKVADRRLGLRRLESMRHELSAPALKVLAARAALGRDSTTSRQDSKNSRRRSLARRERLNPPMRRIRGVQA